MPQYKLTYFEGRGLGETIRMLLTLGDQPFEDVRLPVGPLSEATKKELDLEWGQLPILEIDGVRQTQSFVISKNLAKKFNLAGKNEAEEIRCHEVVEAIRDFYAKIGVIYPYDAYFANDKAGLDAAKKRLMEVDAPIYLPRFENLLKKKGNTWLVGDKMSWADIVLYNTIRTAEIAWDLPLSKPYPAITKLINAVTNDPKIKVWLATRPKTRL